MNTPLVSVILPIYNQADHVTGVVENYIECLRPLPIRFELVLVVNGCRDASLDVCQALAAKHPEILLVHSVPGGWGLAVCLGLAAARGECLCYTNSARTTGEMLVACLEAWLARPECVIKALRQERQGLLRGIGSFLYNLECRLLFGITVRDINGTPKCFSRNYTQLLDLREPGDLIDAEFNAVCCKAGYVVQEVPILMTKRNGGVSTTNYKTALSLLTGVWKLWWRMRLGR